MPELRLIYFIRIVEMEVCANSFGYLKPPSYAYHTHTHTHTRLSWVLAAVLTTLAGTIMAQPLTITLTPSDYNGYAVSCFGEKDGSIIAQITGGVPPYQYGWSTGDVGLTITEQPAG